MPPTAIHLHSLVEIDELRPLTSPVLFPTHSSRARATSDFQTAKTDPGHKRTSSPANQVTFQCSHQTRRASGQAVCCPERETPAFARAVSALKETIEPKHSLAFIMDRERERERERNSRTYEREATATSTAFESTADREPNEDFHGTYRSRHRAVSTPSYHNAGGSSSMLRTRQVTTFPYHFSYQHYAEPPRSAPPALDDLPPLPAVPAIQPLPPLPSLLPPVRALRAAASDESLSSSSSAQPRRRQRPMTVEEKRAARQCTVDGCKNYTIDRGLCFRHGGGKTCTVEGCGRSAKARGLCWRHGGSVSCSVEGCNRGAKSKGLCWSHGGGSKCSVDGCEKTIISRGLCWTHGGGKRCQFEGCKRPASESKQNFCNRHHAELRDGNTVYEV